MTIYACSDLHYGHSKRGNRAVCALARHLETVGTPDDQLLIGGDIAIDDSALVACLGLFASFPGDRLAIAGNHDVWVHGNEGRTSLERYAALPNLFRAEGFHPLEIAPFRRGTMAIVGCMGWYDYSFRDDIGIPIADYKRKQSSRVRGIWADAWHVKLPYGDDVMTSFMIARLQGHLTGVQRAEDVVVLMHHLPTKKLLFHPRFLVPRHMRFMNAFLGSTAFGRVIGCFPNVRHVICGHVHDYKSVHENGARVTSIGGDYEQKMLLTIRGDSIQKQVFHG